MSEMPLVTIIIPTYNRKRIIGDAISSVLSQTYSNKQIVVIDDGSTDDTESLVRTFPEVEYVRQERRGQAAARNHGLERANGYYIASLDSDDVWETDFLESSIEILERENLDFTFANWMQEIRNGKERNSFSMYGFLNAYGKECSESWNLLDCEQLRHLFVRYCPAPSSSMVLRRSSIVSKWNSDLNIADDWCLLLDMILAKECRAAFTKKILWSKRRGGNNVFDGRNKMETVRLLDVEDCASLSKRYTQQLSEAEQDVFRKIQIQGMFQLSIYRMGRQLRIQESVQLFRDAFIMDSRELFRCTPRVFLIISKYLVKRVLRYNHN